MRIVREPRDPRANSHGEREGGREGGRETYMGYLVLFCFSKRKKKRSHDNHYIIFITKNKLLIFTA